MFMGIMLFRIGRIGILGLILILIDRFGVQYMCRLILVIIAFAVCQANIWDNIYSKEDASMPIMINQDISFEFPIPQYRLKVKIDFNTKNQLITARGSINILITDMQVFKLDVNLKNTIISFQSILGQECERYVLPFMNGTQNEGVQINKQSLYFVNLFFKYIGTSKSKGKVYDVYKFQPFLFGKQAAQKASQKIKEQTKELDPEESLDIDKQIFLYVFTDQITGQIRQMYEGKDYENKVPFKLQSDNPRSINCHKPIKVLNREEIKKIIDSISDADFDSLKP